VAGQGAAVSTNRYGYDFAGRRVSKTDPTGGGTTYLWGGDELVEERLPGGALRYENAAGMALAVGNERLMHDALGSTVGRIGNGAPTLYRLDAWGSYRGRSPGAGEASAGYAGQHWDTDAGLSYAQQRWYDPRTGRFLSEDPIPGDPVAPATLHALGYANGNPLSFTDPTGERAAWESETQSVQFMESLIEKENKRHGVDWLLSRGRVSVAQQWLKQYRGAIDVALEGEPMEWVPAPHPELYDGPNTINLGVDDRTPLGIDIDIAGTWQPAGSAGDQEWAQRRDAKFRAPIAAVLPSTPGLGAEPEPSIWFADNNLLTRLRSNATPDGLDKEAATFAQRQAGRLATTRRIANEFIGERNAAEWEQVRSRYGIEVYEDVPEAETQALMASLKVSSPKDFNDTSLLAAARRYGGGLVTGDRDLGSRALRAGVTLRYRQFEGSPQRRLEAYESFRTKMDGLIRSREIDPVEPMRVTGSRVRPPRAPRWDTGPRIPRPAPRR
jgi:RHS repeat-associated protein